jgi:hypothetical protein
VSLLGIISASSKVRLVGKGVGLGSILVLQLQLQQKQAPAHIIYCIAVYGCGDDVQVIRARTERLFRKLMEFSFFGPEVPSSIFCGKIEKIHTTTHATLGGAG